MYDLHRLGWNSFQQLCLTIAREIFGQSVRSFLDGNDAGRDGAFTGEWTSTNNMKYSGNFVIQCKFTARSGYSLKLSDISEEISKITTLVGNGLCDLYVLMTNAGLSARQESSIVSAIKAVGVKDVLILGRTWIEDQIKENTRLRMLVPRVYGLGDLSQILDDRAYAQARAVLESMREDLAKVVITESYRRSVIALDEHGFVLLIGEPAAGKTTIASMLSVAAADKWKSSVIKLDDPGKIASHWNPAEPSQFFWIDDAFGVTQYESGLAHGWNHALPQIKSMIRQGAKIVMTSRDYIYNHARVDLKESAFPLLSEAQVVIDVHDLSSAEKEQILYNHLKLGIQPLTYRKRIKPFLEEMARHPRFIPETARRLADPFFTKHLLLTKTHLAEFVDKREQLLIEVIKQLDLNSKAALGLIYMRKDHLQTPIELGHTEQVALEQLGSTLGLCRTALESLRGSLVVHVQIDDESVWRFKHPTIGDAYASTLKSSPDLLDIFLSGTSTDNLLSQVTCGNVDIENAVVVPKTKFPLMVDRLIDFTSSSKHKTMYLGALEAKWNLYRFLSSRCSKDFLALYLKSDTSILTRIERPSTRLDYRPEVGLAVRLHQVGLLPEAQRQRFVATVVEYAIDGEDMHGVSDYAIRALFVGDEYQNAVERIQSELLPNLSDVRRNVISGHREDQDPSEHMADFLGDMNSLRDIFEKDSEAVKIIDREITIADEWVENADYIEEAVSPRSLGAVEAAEEKLSSRSIFDDIDDDGA